MSGISKKAETPNPAISAIAAHFMQNPPPNLPVLAGMYSQKLERDLRAKMETPSNVEQEAMDPLRVENKRLHEMLLNTQMRLSLLQAQREMARLQGEAQAAQMPGLMDQAMMQNPAVPAAVGGLPPQAGGPSPEEMAAIDQQGGALPQPAQDQAQPGVGPVSAAAM